MLKSLSIRDYAIIPSLEIVFRGGLVIITGETGAGKSIILGALEIVLGGRAAVEDIRSGAAKTVIEAVIGVDGTPGLQTLLDSFEIESSAELILRRELSARGQHRCFINDSPVPLATLRQIGDALVDIHGQHEHQSLLKTATHIDLLDDFGGLRGLVAEVDEAYRTLSRLMKEDARLRDHERQLKEKRDLYEFQIKEIDAVSPRDGEDDELERQVRVLENSERLHESTHRLHDLCYGSDDSVRDRLVIARNELQSLAGIDPVFLETNTELQSAIVVIEEIAKFLQSYNSRIEFDPERLEEIRERLGQISLLKRKYGGSLEAVVQHRTHIGEEFTLAENFSLALETLAEEIRVAREEYLRRAERLSAKRRESAERLSGSVRPALSDLGITKAAFETKILRRDPGTSKGIDDVEFYLSTNAGESPRPLAKVASGGEISRVMLALKSSLAKSDRLPILVFDEIDTGVSGRIAHAVGQALKNLSRFHQIISITHLPQIAGFADQHFVVEKKSARGKTQTSIRELTLNERIEEIARLLSGSEITESGLKSARELLHHQP